MTTLVAARYWRFALVKGALTGASAIIQVGTLRFTDSSGTPLVHSAVVTTGGTQAPYYGTADNVADADGTTYASWARLSGSWQIGEIAIDYDFGSPVTPAKFLFRQRAQSQYVPVFNYSYTPSSLEQVQIFVMSSTDNINWHHVGFYPNPYSTAADVDTITDLDNVLPNYYSYNIIKPQSGDGGIYGIVSEDGVPASRPVYLLERDFFAPVKRTISNASGGYSFQGLNRDRQYCVLAVDTTEETPGSGVYKNALVRDRITPIRANGVPTDGLPWFYRYRSTMLQPVLAANFYGPGDNVSNFAGNFRPIYGPLYSQVNGGGYDLRALDLPIHLAGRMRLLYTKTNNPPLIYGIQACPTTQASTFTAEIVAEIPSGSDPSTLIGVGGPRVTDGNISSVRIQQAVVFELLNTGVINVRAWFSGSTSLSSVRVAGSATPGSVAHILLCYAENSHFKLYVNGVLANTASLAGLGTILNATVINDTNTSWSNTAYNVSDAYYGWYGGTLWSPSIAWIGSGFPARNYSSTAPVTGVGYIGTFTQDMSATPDAAGVPIGVRDLYETYANDSVWLGGSRPNGWPAEPAFTGYGIEVAADAPFLWARMQEPSNAALVTPLGTSGIAHNGYYTATGCDFAQAGMTNGMQSVRFNGGGGLRLYGIVSTSRLSRGMINDMCQGTVECWYTPESRPASEAVIIAVTNYNDNSARFFLSITSAGNVRIGFRDTSGALYPHTIPGTTLNLSTAYHIVVAWDSLEEQRIRMYINGVEVYSTSFLVQAIRHNDHTPLGLVIGNAGTWTNHTSEPYNNVTLGSTLHARGLLQDVALYTYALPAARAIAHYAAKDN